MSSHPMLKFLPVPDPGLPEPYATGSALTKQLYEASEIGRSKYQENGQKINNHEAILAGNKKAEERVSQYNTELENYLINGGEKQSIYPLPSEDALQLEQYYAPAVNAGSTEVPVWSLPPGTVLYEHEGEHHTPVASPAETV